MGADKDVSDKNYRDAIYYAVLSGSQVILKFFLRPERCNHSDKLWGFTPLHLSANQGNLDMVKFLLTYGSSLYILDLKDRTAEQVARDSGQKEVAAFLENERYCAPGQVANLDENKNVKVWIGDLGSLDIHWIADLNMTAVFYFNTSTVAPPQCAWLQGSKHELEFHMFSPPSDEVDMHSWTGLSTVLSDAIKAILHHLEKPNVTILIADETCFNIAPAIFTVIMMLKYQIRATDSLKHIETLRPRINVTQSNVRGIMQMQKSMDDKILARLDAKLRHSNVMSSGF